MPKDYTKMVIEPSPQNPFLPELVSSAKVREKTQQIKTKRGFISRALGVHDPSTGEVLDDALVMGVKTPLDRDEFIKMYGRGLTLAFDLSKRSQDVLRVMLSLYMAAKLPSATNDQIIFAYEDAIQAGYPRSRQVFRSALNELCHYSFLCPVSGFRDRFWINPTLFYKGNRLTLIHHYVMRESNSRIPDLDPNQLSFEDED